MPQPPATDPAGAATGRFLIEERSALPIAGLGLSSHLCRFAIEHYADALFDACGIPFQDGLERAVVKRRAEHLAGRHCARQALLRLGVDSLPGPSGYGSAPSWPAGLQGSISHGGTWAIAVVGDARRYWSLGVDCEHIMAAKTAYQLAGSILVPDETAAAGTLDHATFTTLAFSAKESVYKTVGRLWPQLAFRDAGIESLDAERFTIRVVAPAAAAGIAAGQPMRLTGWHWRTADTIFTLLALTAPPQAETAMP